jgi:hypothetical protein
MRTPTTQPHSHNISFSARTPRKPDSTPANSGTPSASQARVSTEGRKLGHFRRGVQTPARKIVAGLFIATGLTGTGYFWDKANKASVDANTKNTPLLKELAKAHGNLSVSSGYRGQLQAIVDDPEAAAAGFRKSFDDNTNNYKAAIEAARASLEDSERLKKSLPIVAGGLSQGAIVTMEQDVRNSLAELQKTVDRASNPVTAREDAMAILAKENERLGPEIARIETLETAIRENQERVKRPQNNSILSFLGTLGGVALLLRKPRVKKSQ